MDGTIDTAAPRRWNFQDAVEEHQRLRADEERLRRGKKTEELEAAKDARAEFLRDLIESGSLTEWGKQGVKLSLELDTTGLMLTALAQGSRIFSHIPYTKLTPSTVESVEKQTLYITAIFREAENEFAEVTDEDDREDKTNRYIMNHVRCARHDIDELRRRVDPNHSDETETAWIDDLAVQFHEYIVANRFSAQGKELSPNRLDEVMMALRWNPWLLIGERGYGKLPQKALDYCLTGHPRPEWDRAERIERLFEIAEIISVYGSWESTRAVSAWERHRQSLAGARVARRFFADREEQVRGPRMYEPVKIIATILRNATPEALDQMGIRMVRTKILDSKDKKFDCIGLWSKTGFHRVFIDTEKHLRPDAIPPELYAKIPEIPKPAFQGLEAIMSSRTAFMEAQTTIKRTIDDALRSPLPGKDAEIRTRRASDAISQLKEFLFLVVSEIPEHMYSQLERTTHMLTDAIRRGEAVSAQRKQWKAEVALIDEWYAHELVDQNPLAMLERMLSLDDVKTISFDETFLDSAPNADTIKSDREFSSSGITARIFESPPGGLPYAREQQAINMLKLERRPLITITCGASYDTSEEGMAETYAQMIWDKALTFNANVIVPGTQSSRLAMILATKYHAWASGKDAQALNVGPRFFSIEPGADTYYPGNGYIAQPGHDATGLKEALVPLDAILTGYRSGWSIGGSMAQYRRHIHYRQVVTRRLAENLTTATIIINAGKWAAVENTAAAHDGSEHLAAKDMGRHGALCALIAESGALSTLQQIVDLAQFTESVRTLLSTRDDFRDNSSILALISDSAYMAELMDFIQGIRPEQLTVVDTSSIATALERNLAAQAEAIRLTTLD